MANFFKEWIMSLAGVIVFGSMCEMLLPNNSYKKHIHLAIGIMLILTVVSPIKDFTPDKAAFDYQVEVASSSEIEERRNAEIMRVYKEKLASDIKKELGTDKAEIQLEVEDGNDAYGRVKCIYIKTDKEVTEDIKKSLAQRYGLPKSEIVIICD